MPAGTPGSPTADAAGERVVAGCGDAVAGAGGTGSGDGELGADEGGPGSGDGAVAARARTGMATKAASAATSEIRRRTITRRLLYSFEAGFAFGEPVAFGLRRVRGAKATR